MPVRSFFLPYTLISGHVQGLTIYSIRALFIIYKFITLFLKEPEARLDRCAVV